MYKVYNIIIMLIYFYFLLKNFPLKFLTRQFEYYMFKDADEDDDDELSKEEFVKWGQGIIEDLCGI